MFKVHLEGRIPRVFFSDTQVSTKELLATVTVLVDECAPSNIANGNTWQEQLAGPCLSIDPSIIKQLSNGYQLLAYQAN